MVSGSKVPYRLAVFTSDPVATTFRIAADGDYLIRLEGKPLGKDDPAPEVAVSLGGKEVKRVKFVFPEKDAYTRFCGVCADQIAASKIGQLTRLPSLEIGSKRIGGASCDGFPCVVSSTLSWPSPTQPLPLEPSPRAVFDRLFGTGQADRKKATARRSILDTVQGEAASLSTRVSSDDRHKLYEYLTAVRDVERRVGRTEELPTPKPPEGAARPGDGIPAEFAPHVWLMGDMMVLAFQTDVTRVCTLSSSQRGAGGRTPRSASRAGTTTCRTTAAGRRRSSRS